LPNIDIYINQASKTIKKRSLIMKKTSILFLLIFIMAAVPCAASPLTDYSIGKFALDLNFSSPDLSANNTSSDGKTSAGGSLTVGAGFGFAGQYTFNDFKTKTSLNGNNELKAQQLILINNLAGIASANVSLFAGISQTEMVGSSKHSGVVGGVIGSVPIAPNTRGYGVLTVGNKVNGYEVGVGYEFATNTELNVAYHNTTYKNLTFTNGAASDVTRKGISAGVSYKF
jgi:predicted porin